MKTPIFVYILKGEDASFYVGMTDTLGRELCRHRQGLIKSTKGKLPVRLIRVERYENSYEAKFKMQIFEAGYGKGLL